MMVEGMLNDIMGWVQDNYLLLMSYSLVSALAVNRIYYAQNSKFWHPKNLPEADFYDHTRPVVEGTVIPEIPHSDAGYRVQKLAEREFLSSSGQVPGREGLDNRSVRIRTEKGDLTLIVDGLTEEYFSDGVHQGEWIKAKVRERHGTERTLYDIL
ncbi:MAG: hypothetical protein V1729_03530 [Candidatus Woesearchaeota archaeon]